MKTLNMVKWMKKKCSRARARTQKKNKEIIIIFHDITFSITRGVHIFCFCFYDLWFMATGYRQIMKYKKRKKIILYMAHFMITYWSREAFKANISYLNHINLKTIIVCEKTLIALIVCIFNKCAGIRLPTIQNEQIMSSSALHTRFSAQSQTQIHTEKQRQTDKSRV